MLNVVFPSTGLGLFQGSGEQPAQMTWTGVEMGAPNPKAQSRREATTVVCAFTPYLIR